MNDSFGDGWNGASISVVVNGVTYGPYSATGSGTDVNIPVCDGETIQINYLTGGSWPSECSYILHDADGNNIYQAGPNPTVANNVFSGNGECFNPGVLDCNGGDVTLTAEGQGASFPAINNDFDAGSAGTGWNSTVTASFSNPCDPSIDGGTYMWMGNSAPHPRIIETIPLDLSCGGEVCFWLDFATQGNTSPCEGIDLPDEGVFLEYSINGGASWVTMEYFGPAGVGNNTNSGGTDPQMTAWNQYCYTIPAAAQTASTMIHWAQTGSSGLNNDHWGIDNVTIMSLVNCTPYWYDYTYLPPSNDGAVQTVNVTSTTTFTVNYTNGTDACTASVIVPIGPCGCPDATVSGGGTYCVGDDIPNVVFAATGGANPTTLTYAIDGVSQPPITFYASDTTLLNPVDGVYTILAVTDTSLCVGTFSGSADVLSNPPPVLIGFTGGDVYCMGDVVSNLLVEASGSGTLSIEYTLDGNAQTPVTGTSPLSLGNAAGIYNLTLLSDDGCSTPVSSSQTIIINPIPTATAGTLTPVICEGSDILLTSNTATGTYDWSGPNGFVSPNEDPSIISATVAASGTYTLVITENGCSSPPSTVDILVNPAPIVSANADLTICTGTSVTLNGQGATTYSWSDGVVDGVSFTPGSTNTYIVTGTANGCTATASVTVTVLPIPVALGSTSVNSGYAPLPITITNNSTNASSYIWNFGNGSIIPTNSSAPVVTTYGAPGTYYIILTASNGICDSTWSDSVVVISYPAMVIHVPNVFSPNDDDSNDEYFIDVVNGKAFEAVIVNRWGNIVYEMDTLNQGWDGKINGHLATDGVYFIKYKVTGLDDSIQEGHTFFHLIR
jgi:gliding motility-associated-like protein